MEKPMNDTRDSLAQVQELVAGMTPGALTVYDANEGDGWPPRPLWCFKNEAYDSGEEPALQGGIHYGGKEDADAIAACVNFLRAHSAEIAGALSAQTTERRALLWLAGRDSGLSSQAIAYHMLGLSSNGNYPLDPSDLGRCLRMLELFPEWKPRISEMASYSKCWAGLCASWDALAAMMADEVGIDWSKGRNAPKTYQAMQAAMQQGGGGGE